MDVHNCSLNFYDWSWNYISHDCTHDLNNGTKWRNEISNATIWRNDTYDNEMAWIWSYWEEQYIENTDWDAMEDLDWHNPMCNMTNVTAENRHEFECEDFDPWTNFDWCNVDYVVESCDMDNFTCTMEYSVY